jgi:hypothetical protein
MALEVIIVFGDKGFTSILEFKFLKIFYISFVQFIAVQKKFKRSVRVGSTWVITHGYMKAIIGISLYSYP